MKLLGALSLLSSLAFSYSERRIYSDDLTTTFRTTEVDINEEVIDLDESFVPVEPDPFPKPGGPNPGTPGTPGTPGAGGPNAPGGPCDPSQPILPPWCLPGGGPGNPFPGPGSGGGDVITILDRIVNLGLKIWQVVDKGKPVVNLNNKWATALPFGITHWTQLAGWQAPRAAEFEVETVNGFGSQVVYMKYRLVYSYGGNVNGVGKYLTNVKIVPINVSVAWGYTLDLTVDVPDVLNQGTTADPVAGMNLEVVAKIQTSLQTSLLGQNIYLSGDGNYMDLSDKLNKKRPIIKK